ncbi:MAG: hypothetical protein IJT15_01170 [Rickettsiales bacterium]|nr:hypothetical protein [Rickettsiales bacterium]
MTNRCLELQKIVIKAITDIDFLKQNNIKIFSSVPDEAKMPYIKLELLKMESIDFAKNLQRFTITFFIVTANPDNQQLIEIVESLHDGLPDKIKATASIENKIKIFNVVNVNYNIKEDLQNNGWFGEFTMSLDIK